MLRACLDEHRVAFLDGNRFAFDIEHPCAFDDDIDLIVGVRLLAVGSGATST